MSFKVNPNVKFSSPLATSLSEDYLNTPPEQFVDPIALAPTLPTSEDYAKALAEANVTRAMNSMEKYYALSAYGAIYSKVSSEMQSIITAVDDMRSFYLVEVILNQITEDALSPRIGTDEIVAYSHPDPAIQKELDELKKRIGLDQLILNITPDLCAYGEYTLKTVIDRVVNKEDELNKKKGKKGKVFATKSKGITDVSDIVDQGTVIALAQDGVTEGYLTIDEVNGQLEVREVADFIKFSLGGQRVKIDMKSIIPPAMIRNKETRKIVSKIPRFIRMGKSVLYPVLSKLKELELLEKLIPATKLNKLSQGNLVGLPLPDNYDLEQALMASRRVEGMINKKVSVDPRTREITVESILSAAGKTRVIPLLGEKGTLDKLDYKSDEPDDLMANAKDIRELIMDSVGVPSELVFKSDGDSRSEILKRYAKYLRKLKRVQKTLSEGSRQIAFIHLANRGIDFKEEDVELNFLNTLVEIDNLDKLEHADVTTSLLTNVRDFFNDMMAEDSPYKDSVDLNKVSEYIESNLKTVGLSDALKINKEGGADVNKTAEETDMGVSDDELEPDEEE